MEKGNQTPELDVSDESYKGSGRVVTSAGYLYISHMASTLAGMAAVGAAAYIFHGKVNSLVDKLHTVAEKSGRVRKGVIRFIVGDRRGSHELNSVIKDLEGISEAHHKKLRDIVANEELSFFQHKAVKFSNWISKSELGGRIIEAQSDSRMEATFIGASLGAITGWISSTIWSLYKGHQEGGKGKHQFLRAKKQIKNLQEDNADLEKINDDLHAKYVKAATRLNIIQSDQENAAHVAGEHSELPAMKELPDAEPTQTPTPPTGVQLSEPQHHGHVAQRELATVATVA
jgi:hypothetical protein